VTLDEVVAHAAVLDSATDLPVSVDLENGYGADPQAAALAVTSAKRSAALPDVPTIAESGFPGYDVKNNFGVFAPAGTPASVVAVLNKEIRAVAAMDDVRTKLISQGVDPGSSTPAEHRALMEAEVKMWAKLVKDAKITLN
jgi:tripartite-type tricarboxylate transporter receptor subunit TctC